MECQIKSKIEITMIMTQLITLYYDQGFCEEAYDKYCLKESLGSQHIKNTKTHWTFKQHIPFYDKHFSVNLLEIAINFLTGFKPLFFNFINSRNQEHVVSKRALNDLKTRLISGKDIDNFFNVGFDIFGSMKTIEKKKDGAKHVKGLIEKLDHMAEKTIKVLETNMLFIRTDDEDQFINSLMINTSSDLEYFSLDIFKNKRKIKNSFHIREGLILLINHLVNKHFKSNGDLSFYYQMNIRYCDCITDEKISFKNARNIFTFIEKIHLLIQKYMTEECQCTYQNTPQNTKKYKFYLAEQSVPLLL